MVQIKKIFISFIYHENDLMKITRMHSSRMRTARSFQLKERVSGTETPLDRDPLWTENPLDRDLPRQSLPPPWPDKRL